MTDRPATAPLDTGDVMVPDAGSHTGGTSSAAEVEHVRATRVFSQSVVISGIRCLLAYIVFPWVLPFLGVARNAAPAIGITISLVAIGFNVASIRRFWGADHRWKWWISAINVSVICLLVVLLVHDVGQL